MLHYLQECKALHNCAKLRPLACASLLFRHENGQRAAQAERAEKAKQPARDTLAARLQIVEKQLQGREYVTGNQFSVADAYFFTVLGWAKPLKYDLSRWPGIQAYQQRVAARPTVRAAMVAEGLIKE